MFKTLKLDLIDAIIVVFYYLFVCFLILSLFGFFNRLAVSFVLIILFLIIFSLRKYIAFPKKYLWFFLFVPLTTAGFGFLRGFFVGDAYGLWLPAARDIVRLGYFPGISINYFFSRMPLLSLLFAGTFSIFNSFNEFLCLWVPFLSTSATVIIIYQWAKDRGLDKKFLYFIPFLFLTNIVVQFFGGWNLLQESLILLFATAFFYYYENYLRDQSKKNLIFLALSFILACASKVSGFFLVLIIPFIFLKSKDKKRIFYYFFVISAPIILWLFRNYLIFDNPVFPVFNGIFKGRYYQVIKFHSALHVLPAYLNSIWDRFFWTFKNYFWMSFPFVLLSVYGFFKKHRYDYLFLFFSYLLVKELFLFTLTNSSARYYYPFIGLLIVYALLGLQELKSRSFITFLIVLATVGLLLVPVVNSTSQFISLFENKLSFLGQISSWLHMYWYVIAICLIPLVYGKISQKENAKIFLVFLYCLFIFHLKFVANKSWLNTWPFIFLSLLFLIIFIFRERIRYFKSTITAIIILAVFANSWAMASVYYWHQGGVALPVSFIWEDSQWAKQSLDQEEVSNRDFYVLVAAQSDYFNWQTDYRAIRIFNYNFCLKFKEYDKNMSDFDFYEMLKGHKVKYLVKNDIFSDFFTDEYVEFFRKVESSDRFKIIASKDNQYFVWQVY